MDQFASFLMVAGIIILSIPKLIRNLTGSNKAFWISIAVGLLLILASGAIIIYS